MANRRRRLRIAAGAALLLALYVGGYFLLPNFGQIVPFMIRYRRFPAAGLPRIYAPLGWIECKVTGQTVCLGDPNMRNVEFDPGALW
jgi:hypothetical protein